jgi:predicted ABC-type ATPase
MPKKPEVLDLAPSEFFYVGDDGKRHDDDLHAGIIGPVDYPIDEEIMGPIRERHRAKHEEMRAKRRAEREVAVKEEQKRLRLRSQWSRTRARAQALLGKEFIQDPKTGLLMGSTPGPGGKDEGKGRSGGKGKKSDSPHAKDKSSASSRLRISDATVEDVVAKVPGAKAEIRTAKAKMDAAISTDKLVSEGGFRTSKVPGNWTRKRAAEHQRIREEILTIDAVADAVPAVGEQPVLYILGGRGGSGKSWFTKKGPLKGVKALYMNNDDIKEMLPEYAGWNAGQLHEEASELGMDIEKTARENGLNVVIDATLKSEKSTRERIEAFKAAGYRVEGYYMYASPETAAQRAVQRFVDGQNENGKGRYVPPEYSLTSISNEDSFDSQRENMDHWEVYDNDSPEFKPKLTGSSTGDKASAIPNYKAGVKARGKIAAETVRDEDWVKNSPVKTEEQAIAAALVAQDAFVKVASALAEKHGVRFENPGSKLHQWDKEKQAYKLDANGKPLIRQEGLDRFRDKLAAKPGAPVSRITDLARGAFVLNDAEDGENLINDLSKTHELVDEGWATKPDTFYTDRAVLFRDRATGLIGEIQISQANLLKAKEGAKKGGGGGHDIYDKRKEEDKAAITARNAGDEVAYARHTANIERLNAEMRALYGGVLDSLDPQWQKLIDGRPPRKR